MNEYFIGLISGTSIDAVDAVCVDFRGQKPKLIATHKHFIPDLVRKKLHRLSRSGPDEINKLGETDVLIGELFAQAALTLLKKAKIKPYQIKAIGSHGQTIRHQPHSKRPFTVQTGDPNIIAAKTTVTTIADFRRKDMALGGQGAPFAPAFHRKVFHNKKHDRVILNIGGIANITVLKAKHPERVTGCDTGPGNTLLDAWTQKHLHQLFDTEGTWAASGKINKKLLVRLLSDPYFSLKAPKSTGRELFNLTWLQKHLKPFKLPPEDVQATLTELTAASIADMIHKMLPRSRGEVLVCGGGVHNDFLMERLRANVKNHKVHATDKKGLPADWIEAMTFAWFAKQTLNRKPINLTTITGVTSATILGGIYHP